MQFPEVTVAPQLFVSVGGAIPTVALCPRAWRVTTTRVRRGEKSIPKPTGGRRSLIRRHEHELTSLGNGLAQCSRRAQPELNPRLRPTLLVDSAARSSCTEIALVQYPRHMLFRTCIAACTLGTWPVRF